MMETLENLSMTDHLKSAAARVLSGGSVYLTFLGLMGILFIAGVAFGIHSVYIEGSRHAYGTSREVPLAMLIATYAFFVIISTGLCLSLIHI